MRRCCDFPTILKSARMKRLGGNALRGYLPILLPCRYMAKLDIQVFYIERVVFDELAAGFNVFAHERGEDGFALRDVF